MCYKLTVDQGVRASLIHLTKNAVGGRIMATDLLSAGAPLYQCKSCEGFFKANAFYVSNQSKCKECVKADVRKNRAEKLDYYQLYDRQRYRGCEKRKAAACKSSNSEAGKASRRASILRSRVEEPEKHIARNAVNNAIRRGKLERGSSCYFCGDTKKLQAHHHDYSKPLDVFWLCPKCHGKLHTVNGDFHRGNGASN
jgi:Zn finger protein HypA/HybF involved in hydrogenase expression